MKSKRLKMLLAFAMSFSMLAGCSSSSDDDGDMLDAILEEGVLVVGTEGTYSPNSYHDDDGNLVGFDVEVAQKIGEKLGVEVEFVESDWDSLFASMDSGRVDTVINEVEYTEERAEKYDFSEPYTYVRGAVLVSSDNDEVTSVDDLEGKKAAQNLTSSWGTRAEEYGCEIVSVSTMNESVEMILTGRADVTINAETAFGDYMKNHPESEVKIAAYTNSTSSSRVPVVKGNEELLEAINDALDELRESGELAEISIKYYGFDVTSES